MTTTSMASRHRALLGALLILCIGSLLTLSLHSFSDDSSNTDWVVARRPGFSNPPSSSNSHSSNADKVGTGAKGTDVENNSDLDTTGLDYATMSIDSLKRLVQGTILDTNEDLVDPTRPIRPKGSTAISKLVLKPHELHPAHEDDIDDDVDGQDQEEDGDEDDDEEEQIMDESAVGSDRDEDQGRKQSEDERDSTNLREGDKLSVDNDPAELGDATEIEESLDPNNDRDKYKPTEEDGTIEHTAENPRMGTSLADFDVNKVLPSSSSYLLFIPSGETIEAQFYSLLTSLWIAKHSNRTLIIPPPMMSPPSLNQLYPVFAGPKGRKRQRWSTLFDLRAIRDVQQTVLIDNTRPVLQTPFTPEMALEEENPTSNEQAVQHSLTQDPEGSTVAALTGTAVPVKVKCHGPPTAGSWKALDFAGRHFLNRYNLMAEFEILSDPYWNLKPEVIQRNWRAALQTGAQDGSESANYEDDRHRQLVCISGAELVGTENPVIEEMIWQEIGLQIPFSNGVKQQGRQNVVQMLRALEKEDRRNGYIGVHIDKLPSKEFFDLIAKRIAMLQQTEGDTPRPVIVTTTETDPELVAKMDQQPRWLRIGSEDEGTGLFDVADDELGGYGQEVTRAFVMANSAIFVGSRASALSVHATFRIKYEGAIKQVPPRWELY
ncbi:hypothetical protein BGZ70_003422 [Mortierella alpina]|uniref:Uncharacterized protein n=1 Tax=Mortierella alpina TaxID=64518 RepID=A0A9P6LV82_MORAP|nr:hypothetical protein BGZ70_003422 [Mortierella alpina]